MVKKFNKTRIIGTPVKYLHYSEVNVVKAGESAFMIRIPFYANCFPENPQRGWWVKGYKRAEREFEDMVRRSKRVQETLPFEEAE
jgi:hypothetical protein